MTDTVKKTILNKNNLIIGQGCDHVEHSNCIIIGENLNARHDYDIQIDFDCTFLKDKPVLRGYLQGFMDFNRPNKAHVMKEHLEKLKDTIKELTGIGV